MTIRKRQGAMPPKAKSLKRSPIISTECQKQNTALCKPRHFYYRAASTKFPTLVTPTRALQFLISDRGVHFTAQVFAQLAHEEGIHPYQCALNNTLASRKRILQFLAHLRL